MIHSILLVDDTVMLAKAIEDMLQMEGFRVAHAVNGEDALALLECGRYDLIVTDLRMPKMDGIEFIQRVREKKALLSIPIIVLSAQASDESKRESKRAGADLFLTKPFDEEELIFWINHFLR